MWELICFHRAFGCASALINGETGLPVDLNVPLVAGLLGECEGPMDEGLTPLAYAAENLCYGLTVLFLKHGAKPSLGGSEARGVIPLLPLAVGLDGLCNHQLVRDFRAGEGSIYDLFSLFWLPELKEPLDTIKLLAARTRQVEVVGACCVEDCNLVKLAALLMLAWDKLVVDNDINSSSIWRLARIQHDLESDLKKKEILRSMWRVIRLLERSGNFLEEYRTSRVKHEVVPLEVAYKFLTEVELHEEENLVFSANLNRLPAELLQRDNGLLEQALVKKMSLKEMITEPIYFIPKSPETDVEQIRRFSFYSHIECAMRLDDRDQFMKVMHGVDSFAYLDCTNKLAETVRMFMFAFDSANCAAAVLAGETDDILNFSELTDVGWSFLHKAARLETPKLTALLLENGFLADDRRDCDEWNLQAALPLNIALENIRAHYLLRDWKDSKSAIDLVVLLCDNELRRDQIVSDISWLLARAGISDLQVSSVHDTPSRGLYSADHDRVLGQEYRSMIEQRSGHKLLSGNMLLKQAAPNKFSKQGTLSTVLPRSLHTIALTIDADSSSSIPPRRLKDVLQRLHFPMRCVSVMAALRKGVRCM